MMPSSAKTFTGLQENQPISQGAFENREEIGKGPLDEFISGEQDFVDNKGWRKQVCDIL
jgi:hypothetical protein